MINRRNKPPAADGLLRALQAIIENVDAGLVQMHWTGMGADNAANLDAARAAVALALEERHRKHHKPARHFHYRPGNLIKNEVDSAGYRFRMGVDDAWVKIKNIDVYLMCNDKKVMVYLCPDPNTGRPFTSAFAFFAESVEPEP